jgi:hypothetical protein
MFTGGVVKNYPKKDDESPLLGMKAEYIIVDDPWNVVDDVTYSRQHISKEIFEKARNLVIQKLEQDKIKQLEHLNKTLTDKNFYLYSKNEKLKEKNKKLKNVIVKLIMKIKNYKRILNPIKKEKYKRRFTL